MNSTFKEDGIRSVNFLLQAGAIRKLTKEWKDFAKTISDYPNIFKGTGIVICAGGIKYFTCCWVAVKIIRKYGCMLPIEVWYQNGELNDQCIFALEKEGVACKKTETIGDYKISGWALKPYSILHSSFKEVLFMDADNIPLRNPAELFELKEYKDHGAVFWPDFWETEEDNPIWKIIERDYFQMKEQESGQVLINKEKCWKSLNLCLYFNQMNNVYYKLLFGDKDTFRFAWMALFQPFYMITKEPSTCGYVDNNKDYMGMTMIQHVGHQPFFLHRNLVKWDSTYSDEILWLKIKEFKYNAVHKAYISRYSAINGHFYIDLQGDVLINSCVEKFGRIERECLDILHELRRQNFYTDFYIYSNLRSIRPSQ